MKWVSKTLVLIDSQMDPSEAAKIEDRRLKGPNADEKKVMHYQFSSIGENCDFDHDFSLKMGKLPQPTVQKYHKSRDFGGEDCSFLFIKKDTDTKSAGYTGRR